MPFFFWLFLIMAGTWYLFVFRVLCCDECCENSGTSKLLWLKRLIAKRLLKVNFEKNWANFRPIALPTVGQDSKFLFTNLLYIVK